MRIFFMLLFLAATSLLAYADNSLYEKREFVFKGDTLRYRVLFPENYDKSRSYPLVLFLHGAGERGNDNEKQLIHGSSMFTEENNRKNYPSIVIFPQCPEGGFWVEMERNNPQGFWFPKNLKSQSRFSL